MDAEAYAYCGISNASIYTQYKGRDQYENNRPAQTAEFDPSKTYRLIYMGDYVATARLKMRTPDLWTDPVRGEIPLAWGFNPNLSERVPMIFDYLYEYKTDNDFFVAGDSGAGYLNPYLLFNRKHSDLPAGDQAFIEHNQYYFEKFDLDITGFVINGAFPFDQQVKEMYTQFSPRRRHPQLPGQPVRRGGRHPLYAGGVRHRLHRHQCERQRSGADHCQLPDEQGQIQLQDVPLHPLDPQQHQSGA